MEYTISEAKAGIRLICVEGTIQPVSVFIWGPPGIGKSELIDQLRKEYGDDYQMIDLRLAQIDNVDLRGIPVVDPKTNTLHWVVPEDLPTEDNPLYKGTKGFIFLDEFNRARAEVQQSAFQLVLDRRIGGHRLLDSWFIVAAGNLGYDDDTDVGEMDAALKNRFAHFEVKSDPTEWIMWAKQNGIHEDVIGFIQTHPDKLYYKIDKKDNPMTLVTPRSWAKFSRILSQNPKMDPAEINHILGPSLLAAASGYFSQYLADKNIVSAEDIVLHYSKVSARLKTFQRDQIQAINQEVTSFIAKKSASWDDKKKATALVNFNSYIDDCLEPDLQVAFCKYTWKACKETNSSFMKEYMLAHPDKTDTSISVLDDQRARRR